MNEELEDKLSLNPPLCLTFPLPMTEMTKSPLSGAEVWGSKTSSGWVTTKYHLVYSQIKTDQIDQQEIRFCRISKLALAGLVQ